ncbi:MAG: CopG family transcriptional regulator [Gammaproteobacteria bacterium]|nr:CopG family transcriptional regulator [Gammaproteobacteria bacterium]
MSLLTKRSTVYFDPDVHKALKFKSLETSRSISDIVNRALLYELSEDAEDLQAFKDRKHQPTTSFESMISHLKSDGKI